MRPAGVFLLMLVGWAEELERRSQRRHRKTIMLVAMQEIGTVTAPNIIRTKQASQKELCASLMLGRAGAASIMSIIGALGWARESSIMSSISVSFLRSRASRNTSFSCPQRWGSATPGKCSSRCSLARETGTICLNFGGPFPPPHPLLQPSVDKKLR